MSLEFENYAAKGNEFVKLVAESLKVPRDKAGRIIRSVLHALRDRLTHEESFQFLSQLPMALKGVYVDGWDYSGEVKRVRTVAAFLDEVRRDDKDSAGYDFGNDESARIIVSAVFKALNYFVSEGEMNDVTATLPKELKEFVRESIYGSGVVM